MTKSTPNPKAIACPTLLPLGRYGIKGMRVVFVTSKSPTVIFEKIKRDI
jgi:hypothetical protein